MIYLFTNTEFGEPFLAVAHRLRLRPEAPAITVVLSCKRPWPKRRLARLKQRVLWSIGSWRKARRLSRALGAPVLMSANVNRRLPARVGPGDHGFVAGFNQILKPGLIDRFESLVNCHPSLLPFYRGPVPSYWCLANRERASGYTFHRLTESIDQGEAIWQEVVPIQPGDTPERLNARIGALAARAFEQYLLSLTGAGSFTTQTVDAAAVYAHHVDYRSFPTA